MTYERCSGHSSEYPWGMWNREGLTNDVGGKMGKRKSNRSQQDGGNNRSQQDGGNTCGLIMPISAMSGAQYSEDFWVKVREFLNSATADAGFNLTPAWEDEKFGIIHARIIENIRTMPVMIGVIIGQNPNVMLECGMRIWTDKPILLIVEEGGRIPFDLSPLECLEYPIDREYTKMCQLSKDIGAKLKAMISPGYRTFKSHFNVEANNDVKGLKTSLQLSEFMADTTNDIRALKFRIEELTSRLDESTGSRTVYFSDISKMHKNLGGLAVKPVSPIVAEAISQAESDCKQEK